MVVFALTSLAVGRVDTVLGGCVEGGQAEPAASNSMNGLAMFFIRIFPRFVWSKTKLRAPKRSKKTDFSLLPNLMPAEREPSFHHAPVFSPDVNDYQPSDSR